MGDEIASSPGTQASGSSARSRRARVAERAAGKTLLLELGGNGPMVVLDDADARRGRREPRAAFLCAGQSCTAGERFLVHEAVHDERRAARRGRAR